MSNSDYDIQQHIHLSACWIASRAASVKNFRFKVEVGQLVLNNNNFKRFARNPEELPEDFDKEHAQWRKQIKSGLKKEVNIEFSDGVAAKIINVYFKTVLVGAGFHDHPKVKNIHPPIDSVLLKSLAKENFNSKKALWRRTVWSKMNSDEYETVIQNIRDGLGEEPLWKIEEYWQGFR